MSHLTQVKRILKHINGTSDYDFLSNWAGSADKKKVLVGVIQHSRTKHIVIRHLVEKKVVTLEHMTN
jgi:hypothetical protein